MRQIWWVRTGLLGFSAIVLGVLASSPLAAQAVTVKPDNRVQGITMSPPLKEVTLGPGLLEADTTVTLKNTSGQDLSATVQAVDFKSLDEYGGVSLENVGAPATKYSLAKWMHLPAGNMVDLPKGQTETIPVTIENTKDLTPGGHYGAVLISVTSTNAQAPNTVGFKQQLVSLIFVKKLGGEVYGLQLASLKPDTTAAVPEAITLHFKSTGNVHVVPRGYVTVTDPHGKLVAKGIINEASTIILPGTERQLVTLLQPIASTTASGRYKITAYYRYDGQNKFTAKTIYFTRGIQPLYLILGSGTAAIIIVFTLLILRRNHRRRAARANIFETIQK
jgi:hypothetical protein